MMIVNNSLVLATATTQQSDTAGENSGRTPFLQITSPAFNTLIINTTRQVFQAATLFDASGSEVDGQGGGDFGVEGVVGGETVRSAGGAAGTESEQLGSCHDWQDAQHTLFQLANLCIAVSLLTPATFRFHLLFLRCLLLVAFVLFVLWSGLFICMSDVLGWNLTFFLLDIGHIALLLYRHLPARMPVTHISLYQKVFRPLRMSQSEFIHLCREGRVERLSKGGFYAMEGMTPCARRLAILLKGRLKVTYRHLFLHHIEPNQFADAAEYDAVRLQPGNCVTYQVTISASDDSLLLIWEYARLQEYLATQPFVCTLLHYLIGKDVCSQLYVIQERLLQAPDYMSTLASRHSSMVNLRSCLAANDSSSSLTRLALDLTGQSARHANQQPSLRGALRLFRP
ncbi:blood vessel epicardial substance-like isoform X6 [Pomacea canaliculata]|uniref:blood vessel epicardial substance-like isoform X5 n=1 Tax=Pomacea canaliculata TaxID=400727 RepID=UPI000D729805|nr:blood vessel epicardial substance-like isoform X5 [Pomacea canaliculata]XP_025097419.1 blood vessel epicardial substance-like isoform X6 [Pomacea canaliculata]